MRLGEGRRPALCVACRARWAQRSGYCRACGKAAGVYDHDDASTRAAQTFRRRVELQRVQPPVEGIKRTIVVDGVEYDVTWDGT